MPRAAVQPLAMAAAMMLAAATGCGPKAGVQRLPIRGSISYADGQVFDGAISFQPSGANSGPVANAGVVGGRYQFDRSTGPAAGEYRVVVRAVERKRSRPDPAQRDAENKRRRDRNDRREWEFAAVQVANAAEPYDFTLE